MPKSRNRSKRKRKPPPHQPPAKNNEPHRLASSWRSIAAGIGFVASLLGLYVGYQIYRDTIPEIHVANSDESSPFALPFRVTNKSEIFSVIGMDVWCRADKVLTKSRAGLINTVVQAPMSGPVDLPPGGFTNVGCELAPGQGLRFQAGDPIVTAHIFVSLTYFTAGYRGWKRLTDPVEFTWYNETAHPRWIEGPIPK